MPRRTAFKGSASGRRRNRRLHLQPLSNTDPLQAEQLTMLRPTPSKAELACKRHSSRTDKALNPIDLTLLAEYRAQIEKHAARLERKNRRIRYSSPRTESGLTCSGKEKFKSRPISLI